MPTTFPTTADTFVMPSNPSAGDVANAVANLQDAMEMVQTLLGLASNGQGLTLFHKTVTLTSAAAGTAVEIIPNAGVPSDKKCYLMGYVAKVDGVTDWATTATVKIQDKNDTPVDFVTLTASTLDGNEKHGPWSDSATLEDAFAEGTGGTAGKGLQIVGDVNGTGSDLKVTVWGVIKA